MADLSTDASTGNSRLRLATIAAAILLVFQIAATVHGHYAPHRLSNIDGQWAPAVGHHVTADTGRWAYYYWGDQWASLNGALPSEAAPAAAFGFGYTSMPGFIQLVYVHCAWTIAANVFFLAFFVAKWRNVSLLGLFEKLAAGWNHLKGYRIKIVHCP